MLWFNGRPMGGFMSGTTKDRSCGPPCKVSLKETCTKQEVTKTWPQRDTSQMVCHTTQRSLRLFYHCPDFILCRISTVLSKRFNKTTMRMVICLYSNNILWQIPSGMVFSLSFLKPAERKREIKAAASSGPVLLPERHMNPSTALQDLDPLSSRSGIESSRRSNQPGFGSLKNALLFWLLWNAKP